MPYNDDKRELLKLKQGIITESELIKEESAAADKKHYEVKGFKNKVSNFIYLYKLQLVMGVFIALIAALFIYSMVSKEKADISVLVFSGDETISAGLYYKGSDIELALEHYTDDFDENDKVHADVYCIDLNPQQDANLFAANQTKFYSEISIGTAQMFIADRKQLEGLIADQEEENGYEDLSALYPDNPQVVDKYYYKVKGSPFAETAGYTDNCPEDLYIAIRSDEFNRYITNKKIEDYHSRALSVFDNIVNDNKVSTPTEKPRA